MGKRHLPLAFVYSIKTKLFVAATVTSLLLAVFCVSPQPVAAACAAPTTNIGSASVTLNVPTAGAYVIWSRIQAPNTTNNSYSLEVDGGSCYIVGDSAIPANTWTWVNYQNGTASSKISTTLSAGNHTFKLVGREASVKVDRIMALADTGCTPTGTGDNCATKIDAVAPKVTLTAPATNTTVSGTVNLTATATDDTGVSKVEFYVNNQLQSTDTTAPYSYAWNTATSTGGAYTIVAKAYDAAGNSATNTHTVTIKNGTADTQVPTTPQSLKATVASSSQINLTWSASTDNTLVSGYDVYRTIGSAAAQKVGTSTMTQFGDSGLSAGTTYTYYVVARDAANNSSAHSTIVTAKTTTADTGSGSSQARTSTIRGKVTNDQGRSVSRVHITVTVSGKNYRATTNHNGVYRINRLPAGHYSVTVTARGYADQTVPVDVTTNNSTVLNIKLTSNR